jgi:hypothetical protein
LFITVAYNLPLLLRRCLLEDTEQPFVAHTPFLAHITTSTLLPPPQGQISAAQPPLLDDDAVAKNTSAITAALPPLSTVPNPREQHSLCEATTAAVAAARMTGGKT